MGRNNQSQEVRETTETAGKEEHIDARPRTNTIRERFNRVLSYLACGCSSSVGQDDSNIIAQTNIPEKNRDTKQDSGAVEDTSGLHLFHEEHTERASAAGLRSSWYDNTENSHNCEAVLIHGSPESEEKKIDKVPTQTQIEHSCKKQKDSVNHKAPPEENDRRKSKDVPSQKQVEHSCKKQKDSVIYQQPSEENKETKSENLPNQKQDSVIYQLPSDEYKGWKSENLPTQKDVEHSCKKQKETELGTCQRTTHFPVSTTSAAQPLYEEPEAANDQEQKQVPSPTASVAQTPQKKLPDVHTIEKEIEIPERKTSSPTDKPKKRNETMKPMPVGLQNLGNTCFFNAVMQNLNQSFLLCEVLTEKGCRLSLTKSMLGFYNQMCSGTSTVNPRHVLSNICQRSPRFSGGHQQDSHELLRHLLDGLRTEEREFLGNANNRKILTKVDKVFGGHFMTVYTCRDCKTPYLVCEPLLDISLPIAYEDFQTDEESSVNEEDGEVSQADTAGDGVMYQKVAESLMTPLAIKPKKEAQDNRNDCVPEAEDQQPSKKKQKKNKRKNNDKSKVQHSTTEKRRRKERSILDCLDAFTRTEHIADEYLCVACHAQRVNEGATDYQMTSAKKRTLIYNPPALLTLHLKRFKQTPYGFVKCNEKISFQDMIDIGPYCSSWCMRNEGNERSIWYSLYGLVEHSGSLDGGHYVAYVKLRETEANIRQFLQESYLDRDLLTVEKLEEMMKQMHDLPKQPEKWQPKPVKGTWFYISDSHFSEVSEDEVWRQQAYLLFYERRQSDWTECYRRVTVYPEETCV